MLIGGVALGLVLGLVLGGKLDRLADIRLQFLPLLFLAVIVRFGTEAMLGFGVDIVDTLRVPLLGFAYALLLFVLWHNRSYPGLALAFVGIASNALVIMVNGGYMPVWEPAYVASGITEPLDSVTHIMLTQVNAEFLLRLGPLSDVIPIPIWPLNNVASIGDIFLSAGLAFFLFATLLRSPVEAEREERAEPAELIGTAGTARLRAPAPPAATAAAAPEAAIDDTLAVRGSTGLSPGLEEAAALERPIVLGGGGTAMVGPSSATLPAETVDAGATAAAAAMAAARTEVIRTARSGEVVARPYRRPLLARIRHHPYVRLALNGSFSALWMGQVISLFGDRVHQIALLAVVYTITDSTLAVALTFIASTLPNLLFSPVAGALVDRWEQKQVLVVSDILRASLVLLVPPAILINVWLAYPIVFAITTVSIFFRPARVAILPRIVREHDLLSANSAMWVGETIADVVDYPLAGLFVLFLADSLPLAFWFDAATYLVSAALLATMVVPPIVKRRLAPAPEYPIDLDNLEPPEPEQPEGPPTAQDILADLKVGWVFLRHEMVLLANTIQGMVGQFAVGVVTAVGIVLAKELTPSTYTATYAFMETAIGVGNLIGGFFLGLLAARVQSKGRLIIGAYTAFGICIVLVGLVPPLPMVLGLMFGIGVANMAFVIPSQTLFQERTPPEMMGRVVSLRFALVFGGMTVAMAFGGLAAGVFGVGPVIALAGVLSVCAGLAGLFVRAVRDA